MVHIQTNNPLQQSNLTKLLSLSHRKHAAHRRVIVHSIRLSLIRFVFALCGCQSTTHPPSSSLCIFLAHLPRFIFRQQQKRHHKIFTLPLLFILQQCLPHQVISQHLRLAIARRPAMRHGIQIRTAGTKQPDSNYPKKKHVRRREKQIKPTLSHHLLPTPSTIRLRRYLQSKRVPFLWLLKRLKFTRRLKSVPIHTKRENQPKKPLLPIQVLLHLISGRFVYYLPLPLRLPFPMNHHLLIRILLMLF